ncbi:tryptophan-rich sensory protein [bacterium]|nr:MAG: tryptophan-rich sensory protein [bacterium]
MRVGAPTRRGRWLALPAFLLATGLTGAVAAIASVRAADFYGQLQRPSWAPPASLFGPVWTVLYLLIGVAGWLAWREHASRARGPALTLYAAQLGLNALWSWLFFAWHLGGLALLDICLMWLVVLATLVQFWRLRPLAGALLVPYLLWISFATALNAAVWRLNPTLL